LRSFTKVSKCLHFAVHPAPFFDATQDGAVAFCAWDSEVALWGLKDAPKGKYYEFLSGFGTNSATVQAGLQNNPMNVIRLA